MDVVEVGAGVESDVNFEAGVEIGIWTKVEFEVCVNSWAGFMFELNNSGVKFEAINGVRVDAVL